MTYNKSASQHSCKERVQLCSSMSSCRIRLHLHQLQQDHIMHGCTMWSVKM